MDRAQQEKALKKYLTRKEQRRVLRVVRRLQRQVLADWERRGKGRHEQVLGRLHHIRYNIRAGYLFCADVPFLAMMIRYFRKQDNGRHSGQADV